MLEKIRYCNLDSAFNVKKRLSDLQRWESEWLKEDRSLAVEQRHCNIETREGIDRLARIATIRNRLRLNRVREPLSLPTKEEILSMDIKALQKDLRGSYRQLGKSERLQWLENLRFVMTPDLHKANKKIEDLLEEATTEQRRGLLLFGDSRMGKTCYLDFLWCQFRPLVGKEHNIAPIIKAEAPASNLSTITLPQRLVMEFGNVSTAGDNEERLNRKLAGYIQICGTVLGFIDEAENISTKRMQRKLIELWNLFPNVVLVCASCEIQLFALGGNQIRNRWDVPHELKTFSHGDLKQLLAFLEFIIPLTQVSNLSEDRIVKEVLDKTRGNLWRVIGFIRRASEAAIQRDQPKLTLELLKEVWDLYMHSDPDRWTGD
jgi:hypothetical protein